MIWPAAALAAAAGIYYLLVLVAALLWRRTDTSSAPLPPISILKPVHGRDPRFYDAIRSHAIQNYPEFELLFAVHRDDDPALEDIRRLQQEFPHLHIRAMVAGRKTPNGKVGLMAELARAARYPVLLVNDSDIRVPEGYLRTVVAGLAGPRTGLVTCLYRAASASPAARWEAIGIATEFAPSVLLARLIGVVEFALGSTMAFRADLLRKIGGFEAIADYLADDYQLGRRITAAGYRVAFAPAVVETDLGVQTWTGIWRHQLRWSRTIRVSRPGGYFGYAVTHATMWSLLAAAAGAWQLGAAVLALRVVAGVAVGAGVLGDRALLWHWPLIPFRDLWGFAVWLAGLGGSTVEWRGQRLRLSRDGKIRPAAKAVP
ncbi:MAG TPA: bacteriohopanetetrol glucosamine biosynthesis glycosyltransferase HpnI [Bryobacteraceae bacterium]|nr:bacteriohopanetetrol glucosamine biosynthesis glycosyltransferase HpnI [Bryobacteraceae bacterium]